MAASATSHAPGHRHARHAVIAAILPLLMLCPAASASPAPPDNRPPVIVDLSTYAGHDARFRFRIASNNTNPREGWYIDDIRVVGCGDLAGDTIFADGFEAAP